MGMANVHSVNKEDKTIRRWEALGCTWTAYIFAPKYVHSGIFSIDLYKMIEKRIKEIEVNRKNLKKKTFFSNLVFTISSKHQN